MFGWIPAVATLPGAGMEVFGTALDILHGVVAGAAEDIAASGVLGATGVRAGLEELRLWKQREDAALWHALPLWWGGSRSDQGLIPLRSSCAASMASTS